MLELQRIRFAGWALTEGQHRPKADKKKKTREAGLFFLVPTSQVMLHPKWVKKPFPDPVRSIVHIRLVAGDTWIHVDRQGLVFFRARAGPNVSPYPVQVPVRCFSADRRCRFLETILGAGS